MWIWNALVAEEDAVARAARIEKAYADVEGLQSKLHGNIRSERGSRRFRTARRMPME